MFYIPNYLGHSDNYIPANPLQTPSHIVPEWYFLPFYAILRAIPNKLGGVVAMFASILVLFFLPWLDTSKVRSARYRPLFRQFFWILVVCCIGLGYLGSKPAEGGYVIAARILDRLLLHSLPGDPAAARLVEKPRPVPASISESVLRARAGLCRPQSPGSERLSYAQAHPRRYDLALSLSAAPRRLLPKRRPSPRANWSFSGPFGLYDRAQLQRGFKVYREVCAACHGLKLVAFRTLASPGGLGFTERQAKQVASEYRITDGPNDRGEMFERPGHPSDYFLAGFPNEQAARARLNGALPPDLSVIAKARSYEVGFPGFLIDIVRQYQENGVDYVHALLTGYENAPAGTTLTPTQFWNKYFPGHHIAMRPPFRRPDRIYGRLAADSRSILEGRDRVPDVDR